MTTITRREHQVRALTKLSGHYSGGGRRAQIHWACGTGKTYVGRWLAEDERADVTLVLLPSLALVAQTLAEWQAAGGWPFTPMVVCSDRTTGDAWRVEAGWWAEHGVQVTTDIKLVARFLAGTADLPRVVFSTYHSAPVVAEAARRARRRLGLVVCDEAHHLAGCPDARFRVALDDSKLPARRRLFATATPVLTSGGPLSMANEKAFGPVLDRLDFAEAIDRGLLVDYEVLVLDAAADDGLPTGLAVPAAVSAAVRHGASRIISFHSRVATARMFAAAVNGVTLPSGQPVWAAAVAGTDPAVQRREALDELADTAGGGVKLVSNSRCLAEGVDVPGVDAVVFGDPKTSDTDIIQALSRALRTAPGKTRGLIVLPVAVPAGGVDVDDEALFAGPYAAVWGVLRALRHLDPRMAAELDRVRHWGGGHGRGGGPRGDSAPTVTFEIDGVDLSSFVARVVDDRETNQELWDATLELLRAWAREHGHTAVPASERVGDRWLGRWVAWQRRAYAAAGLSPQRVAALNSVPGWSWTYDGAWWYADVAAVAAAAGARLDLEDPDVVVRSLIHRPGKTAVTVGRWCAQQRRDWRDGLLTERQMDECETIPGWTWDAAVPERDLRMVDALAEYVEANGDANVPHDVLWGARRLPLGRFVTALRRRAVTGRLALALVEDIAVVTPAKGKPGALDWRTDDTRWEVNYLALRQFVARTGGCDIPEHHVEPFHEWNSNLYAWATRQRHLRRHGELSREREALLKQVRGWLWERLRATRVAADIGVRSHGSRAGYAAGCRCDDCTEANAAYEQERQSRAAAGGPTTDLVDAAEARGHLRILEAQVPWRGRPAMQEITGFNKKTIDEVINGERKRIQPWVHEALMALTADRLRAHIAANPLSVDPLPVAPTLTLIDDMVGRGWPRAWISRELGGAGRALQIGRYGTVHRRTADAVEELHRRIGGRVPPPRRWRTSLPTLDEIIAAEQLAA